MKEIKTTADIANATAIDLGPLAEIKDYVLELGPNVKIPGKVFGGAAVKAGGADFSLQVFAPGTEGGFYHTHKEHEELYFFLYSLSTEDAKEVTFPEDNGLVVLAAAESLDSCDVILSTPLYDRVEKRTFDFEMSGKEKKQHKKMMKKYRKTPNQS